MVGRTVPLLLLVSLLLSGCASSDEPADGDAESTNSLDAGADTSDSAAPVAPDTPDTSTPALNRTEEPFSWTGTVNNMAGGCAVVVCQFHNTGAWDGAHDLQGIVAGSWTLTWDSPTTPELSFGLASSCDGGCEFVDAFTSKSPATLDADGLDPERTYQLVVWHPYRCEPFVCAAGVQVGAQAEFQVEGTVTVAAS